MSGNRSGNEALNNTSFKPIQHPNEVPAHSSSYLSSLHKVRKDWAPLPQQSLPNIGLSTPTSSQATASNVHNLASKLLTQPTLDPEMLSAILTDLQ